ncbi:TPA: hypothetical protein HA244_03825 [Candidatus Micrarchaeota archaeon]|nr:hypothetical protein [Candidatus Micrarchaeota archaeon]
MAQKFRQVLPQERRILDHDGKQYLVQSFPDNKPPAIRLIVREAKAHEFHEVSEDEFKERLRQGDYRGHHQFAYYLVEKPEIKTERAIRKILKAKGIC